MSLQPVTREKVIELVEHLPSDVLPDVFAYLEKVSQKRVKKGNSSKEQVLVKTIQHRLSAEEQARLDELREKSEWGELTEDENKELSVFVERVEREDAERAKAIVQLARVRDVPVTEILQQFPV